MSPIKRILGHLALGGLSIVFLIPFAWLLVTSFKSESHLNAFPPEWVPRAEYVKVGPDEWAEVVRNEVIEYAPIEYDTEGKAVARRPLRSKVNLVDRFGSPLKEFLFTIDTKAYIEDLRTGVFSESFFEVMAEHGIELDPGELSVTGSPTGDEWTLTDGDRRFLVTRPNRLTGDSKQLRVHLHKGTRIVDSSDIMTKPWPTFRHYVKGLRSFKFDLFLQNTLFITVVAVAGTVLSCSWVAFGFSILQWRGRDKLFYIMLSTLMLPPQVTMIPLFLIFRNLGWINTYAPLLVPAFLGNAFFIFLLRQFFLTIPRDLIDAARVDGCSTFRIYWQIVIPLSIPALATVALFTFMITWNDYMGPLVYVVDEAKYTLSLGLAMFKGRFATRYGEMMAVSVMLTIPIIILFFFTQKTFIQGIKTSGMKG